MLGVPFGGVHLLIGVSLPKQRAGLNVMHLVMSPLKIIPHFFVQQTVEMKVKYNCCIAMFRRLCLAV